MLSFLLLAGCDPWVFPEGDTRTHDALWDPAVAVLSDGVYVRLGVAGALVRVLPDGTWSEVDLDGGAPERLLAAPDGSSVLVSTSWQACEDDDPEIVYPGDCPSSRLTTEREMVLVRDGERVGDGALPRVSATLNAVAWTADSSLAALYVDPDSAEDVQFDGFLNLNEVTFVDGDATVHRVPVGFAPESVLFTADNRRAVILSRSHVAVIDLATGSDGCDAWSTCVTYPLTLDADQAITPNDVVIVADGRYALVSIESSTDLYVLDLQAESIDLLELSGAPSVLLEDVVNDRTLVAYAGRAQIDVIEHEFFELQSIEIEEPASAGVMTASGALFYNDLQSGYKDVIMVDALSGDWAEQRAENPIIEMLAGTRHAVATMRAETASGDFYDSHYGFGIFTIAAPGAEDVPEPVALVLESAPVGFATIEGDVADYALLLLSELDTILKVRLDDASAVPIELPAPPVSIAATPGGGFVVVQDSALGSLSFLDPADDTLTTATGFATLRFAETPILPRRAAAE